MATIHPRLNVVLDPLSFTSLKRIAKKEGVSLSLKAREMIQRALELYEDRYLARAASTREKTFHSGKAVSHERIWAHLKPKRR